MFTWAISPGTRRRTLIATAAASCSSPAGATRWARCTCRRAPADIAASRFPASGNQRRKKQVVMSWTCGIIGLPNAGKTTIFNALTSGQAEVASYPFSTIAPNIGVVPVPDPRLARLGDLLHPQRLTAATISFVDVAGLIEGASR